MGEDSQEVVLHVLAESGDDLVKYVLLLGLKASMAGGDDKADGVQLGNPNIGREKGFKLLQQEIISLLASGVTNS